MSIQLNRHITHPSHCYTDYHWYCLANDMADEDRAPQVLQYLAEVGEKYETHGKIPARDRRNLSVIYHAKKARK